MAVTFTHNVIPTPIDTVNILGAGGVREGTIMEVYGPNGSGKSSLVYEIGSNFQKKYPDGQVIIIDPETSIDYTRLKYAFDYDLERVHPRPASSLEEGFSIITDVCQGRFDFNKKPGDKKLLLRSAVKKLTDSKFNKLLKTNGISATVTDDDKEAKEELIDLLVKMGVVFDDYSSKVPRTLVIWDSIAASNPSLEVEAALSGEKTMNAGGMGLRARVLTQQLANVNSQLYGSPVTIILLNQVRATGFGTYMGPHDHNSSGGNALKHYVHYKIYIKQKKKLYDDVIQANVGTISEVSIEKSKFCPTTQNIQIYIDDRVGGKIQQIDEIQLLAIQLKIIGTKGGWHYWPDEWNETATEPKLPEFKKFRFAEVRGNEEIRQRCIREVAKHYRKHYSMVDALYREAGLELGNLTDEERNIYHQSQAISVLESLDADPHEKDLVFNIPPDEIV